MTSLTPFFNNYRSTAANPEAAPKLTLLHGWGLHSLVWDQIMPSLLAHFAVTVIDLPGMGNSPIPNEPYSLDLLADQVAAVMPEQTHLLGWSLGGLVALRLAERFPERVHSLATISTNPCFCQRDDWPQATPQVLLERFGQLVQEDANGNLIRFMALNCNGSPQQQTDLRMLKEILHFCGLPAPRALRDGLEILRESDLREAAAKLTQPLLMLFSEQDAILPVAAAAEVATRVRQAQVEVLPNCSHLPFLTQHEKVTAKLLPFWQQQGIIAGAG